MQKTKTDKIKCLILDIDRHIWLISVIGILVLAAKCFIVYPVQHVGESDASGYAEMADSLSHGRWLSVELSVSFLSSMLEFLVLKIIGRLSIPS